MKKSIYLYLALLCAGLLQLGCSERTNPADFAKVLRGNVYTYRRAYSSVQASQWFDFIHHSNVAMIYAPPGFTDPQTSDPYPILYLLHDFNGNENYYFNAALNRVADSLIAIGRIGKMFIVTIDANTPYGGSWYTNNPFQGNFEDLITAADQLRATVESPSVLKVIPKRAAHAISGFGMGGYGAIRLAARHPELYSSVSTSNCAGIFASQPSEGLKGLDSLIRLVFQENGKTAPIEPDQFATAFDTAAARPFTRLFVSMAQAFSPHPDDGADSTTFLPKYGIDLPFDYNGNLYQPVWQKWLDNELDAILAGKASDFDSIAVHMEASDADQFSFSDQAQMVKQVFDDLNIDYDFATYSGYAGHPATNQRFIYDRLAQILIFNSQHMDFEP